MKNILCFLILIVIPFTAVMAQNAGLNNGVEIEEQGINIGDLVQMSGTWFIAYRDGIRQIQADDVIENPATLRKEESSFVLKRSYLTLKKALDKTFSVRYTMDLTVDKEGLDAGNVEMRLKYLYVKAKLNLGLDFLTGTWVEGGMVHRPWLDYEQRINTYRVQDNMAIERNKIFNSADFGITMGGNIGPKMDEKFLNETNGAMKGKWASYALGIYNGGGYSAPENNLNKVFAMRLSTRPFANTIPEIQLSGYFNIGKGNLEESPDFRQYICFLAYAGKVITVTGQYHWGVGDFRAIYVLESDPSIALDNKGYSFFSEVRIPKTPFALWARYDYFTVKRPITSLQINRTIGGLTYRINKSLRLVLNGEFNEENDEKNTIYELNMEVTF